MDNRVMFVDDEKFILSSLKRLFKNAEFSTVFMNSGKEALEYLEENKVDLVISDIRMPEMDGFEFLSKVKEKYHETGRIALSGFSDNKIIYRLLNENIAKLYLFKPWDNEELKATVKRILQMEQTLLDSNLLELIGELDELPALPDIYTKISTLIKEEASVEKITTLIEEDQAIASKILRIANSAFYGKKTGTISQAVMLIGLNNLKNLILTNSMFDKTTGNMKAIERLWKHTVSTNIITHLIYEECLDKAVPQEYSSAGLLHDIGKVVLYLYFSDSYALLNEHSEESGKLLEELEMEHYGVTHQELGAYLLNWWELPFTYVEVAMHHHRPFDERVISKELVSVIYLASHYSSQLETGLIHNEEEQDVLNTLGIKVEQIDEILLKLNN